MRGLTAAIVAGLIAVVFLTAQPSSAAKLTVDGGVLQVFTYPVNLAPIPATIDIDPDTLNPGSEGNFVMAYIELPEGFSVGDIVLSTVTLGVVALEGSVPARAHPSQVGDHDEDGMPDLMVKFDRPEVIALIGGRSGEVTFRVTGQLSSGKGFEGFEGFDVVRVLGFATPTPAVVALLLPSPTATFTPTPTWTPTATPTLEPTSTTEPAATPSPTPTPTSTATPTPTWTPTPTATPEVPPTPQLTATPTPTPTPTSIAAVEPTAPTEPTSTPVATWEPTPTPTPTTEPVTAALPEGQPLAG